MSAAAWALVGAVGGAAAASRFLVDAAFSRRVSGRFPAATLAINLAGTLVLGLVAGATLHGEALIVVAGGGLGSFTTFSTWIFESHRLGEAGHAHLLWLNVGLSLIAGFAALALGHWIGGVL